MKKHDSQRLKSIQDPKLLWRKFHFIILFSKEITGGSSAKEECDPLFTVLDITLVSDYKMKKGGVL